LRTLIRVSRLRVALCQLNTVVGDLAGNTERIIDAVTAAERAGADLAVFPELAVTGYPPEDLLLKPGFVADNLEALAKVAAATERCAAAVGFVDEGRLRQVFRRDGTWYDMYRMGLLEGELGPTQEAP